MSTEIAESYLRRNGITFQRQDGKNGPELKIPCPEPGCSSNPKKMKASVNASTWKWRCFVCGASGNEYSMKKLHGNMYELRSKEGAQTLEEVAIDQYSQALSNRAKPANDIERWNRDLLDSQRAKVALDYLTDRGFTVEILRQAMIGWVANPFANTSVAQPHTRALSRAAPSGSRKSQDGWITIPFFTQFIPLEVPEGEPLRFKPDTGTCALVKCRAVSDNVHPKYVRMKGGETVLYQPGGIDPDRPLLVVGGELDALSVMASGVYNVVSGSGGEGTWKDVWTRQLQDVRDIVLIYDNDDAGQAGVETAAEKLGRHRTRQGHWPDGCKDANESLVQGKLDIFDIQTLIQKAKAPAIEGVQHIANMREQYLRSLQDLDGLTGLSTGLSSLDDLLGGWRKGEVTMITGDTGCGKTTIAAQFALHAAGGLPKKGKPVQRKGVLFCPFEMGNVRQMQKWVRMMIEEDPDIDSIDKVNEALDRLESIPLWTFFHRGDVKPEPFRQTLMYAAHRLDVSMVFIDHIHFVVTEGPGERAMLDGLMKMLAEVATDTGLHIVVLAHPSKIGGQARNGADRDNIIVQAADIKGSSGLKQISDNILSIWRPRKRDRSDVVDDLGFGSAGVYVMKCRSEYGDEGACELKFWTKAATYFDGLAPASSTLSTPAPQRHFTETDNDW